jgi:dTDP-4-dehydrorhamnose 3,5-epimerase-like enzyme
MNLVKWVDITLLGDTRGGLISFEGKKNIPFDIKRVYYLYATKLNEARGFHAHKDLKQVAVCVSGRCKIVLDNGNKKEEVWLDSPEKAILIESFVWREMHEFSDDCVLLVLASELYDEKDYIRDYDVFIQDQRKIYK